MRTDGDNPSMRSSGTAEGRVPEPGVAAVGCADEPFTGSKRI
jgi:hypothetical protein